MSNHVGASTGYDAAYTTGIMNGKATLNFIGDGLSGTLPELSSGTQQHTIIVVVAPDTNGGTFLAIGNTTANNEMIQVNNHDVNTIRYSFFNDDLDQPVVARNDSNPIFTTSYNGTTGSLWHNDKFLGSKAMSLSLASDPDIGIGHRPTRR